jgi:hypothetical protein
VVGVPIGAAADRREAGPGLGPGLPEVERRLEEEHARPSGRDLDRVEPGRVDLVCPGASDAEIPDVERRVVDGEERALLVEGVDGCVDGDPGLTDLVIDEACRADPVRVTIVRRELDAGQE